MTNKTFSSFEKGKKENFKNNFDIIPVVSNFLKKVSSHQLCRKKLHLGVWCDFMVTRENVFAGSAHQDIAGCASPDTEKAQYVCQNNENEKEG